MTIWRELAAGIRFRMLRLVVLVGVLSGLAAAVFVAALRLVAKVLGPQRWDDWPHLAVLGGAGLAIGVITLVLGNPGDVELLVDNIHVSGGRRDIRDLRALLPVALIGIAAGSAIGPEAPLVQTTGSIGSWLGLRLNLDDDDLRLLTISGMAAGFTVLLGVPIGSAIFALEILHRRGLEYYEALVPALLGSLSGFGVYVAVTGLGLRPVWSFPPAHEGEMLDLALGAAAGVAGALLAAAFTYLAKLLRGLFRRLPPVARPVAGGLVLGALAFATRFALTFGEVQVDEVLATRLAIGTLVLAGLGKLVASAAIVSSGWRGGFIIPLFFVGVALGSAASQWLDIDRTIAMTALMAAINVGVTKTPIGTTIVVSEMAGLRIFPSTLIAAVVALLLTSNVSMIETQREREGAYERREPQAAAGTGRALLALVRR
jgi:H+/Cl- antiporter ClcA